MKKSGGLKMNLAAFIQGKRIELEEFNDYWRIHNKGDETNYPGLMEPGEWDEQFETFRSRESDRS